MTALCQIKLDTSRQDQYKCLPLVGFINCRDNLIFPSTFNFSYIFRAQWYFKKYTILSLMMISNHIKQIHVRQRDPVDISGYCDGRDINFAHFFGVRIWEFDNFFYASAIEYKQIFTKKSNPFLKNIRRNWKHVEKILSIEASS